MPLYLPAVTSPSFCYLPSGWDSEWKAAKAASGSTPCWITVIGDSIAAGVGTSDPMTKGWVSLLNAQVATTPYAEYWPAHGCSALGVPVPGTYPWSGALNGFTFDHLDIGSGYHRYSWDGSGARANAQQQFTLPYNCTSVDVLYLDQYAGTFDYKVGAAGRVTTTKTTTSQIKRVSIAGPITSGTVIQFGWQSAAGALQMMGVVCYRNSTGIGMGRCVASIARAYEWDPASGGQTPTNRVNFYSGENPQSGGILGGGYTGSFNWGIPTQPHLTILDLSKNDCFYGTPIANFQNQMERFIQAVRRGRSNASLLLLETYYPNGFADDCGSILPPPAAPAVAASAGTLSAVVSYAYAIGFGSAWGETIPGPVTAGQIGSTGYSLTWTAAPTGTDHVSIYRSTAGGGYKLIAQGAGTATTFTDSGSADATNAPNTDTTPPLNYAVWNTYHDVMWQMARQYNCALVDIHAKWASSPVANGQMTLGNIHPTDAGHADIAAMIASVI